MGTGPSRERRLDGAGALQGRRPAMEDTLVSVHAALRDADLFAVFDGHGGSETSTFLKENVLEALREVWSPRCSPRGRSAPPCAPLTLDPPLCGPQAQQAHAPATKDGRGGTLSAASGGGGRGEDEEDDDVVLRAACLALDEAVLSRGLRDGSTGLLVLRRASRLTLANVGDSRAVLSRDGRAVALTTDATPRRVDEAKRVERAGGHVRLFRVRVDGVDAALAVSRAFGDAQFKQHRHVVTAEPEIRREALTGDDEFLIIASDGVWGVMTNQGAVSFVRNKLAKGDAQSAADALVKHAVTHLHSNDNASAIVVILNSGTS